MNTRATILAGDARSPVVLHVPDCPPMPADFTPQMLLDGSLDTAADRIAQSARTQATRRPFVVLNRLPSYLDELAVVAPPRERRDGHPLLCPHHGAALTTSQADAYFALVHDIVAERIAATSRAVMIEVRTTPAEGRAGIVLGVDPVLTPPALIDAAVTAFDGYDVDVREEGTTRFGGAESPIDVPTLTIDVHRDAISDIPMSGVIELGRALARIVDGLVDLSVRDPQPHIHRATTPSDMRTK